jgi:hypothetical protein
MTDSVIDLNLSINGHLGDRLILSLDLNLSINGHLGDRLILS